MRQWRQGFEAFFARRQFFPGLLPPTYEARFSAEGLRASFAHGVCLVVSLDLKSHLCHSYRVTVLRAKLKPGESIFEQLVFAAKKAFISGEFIPGQPFPSVRTLATELKIHPNTAHKVVQHLIHERWLESRPGIGTVVAEPPEARVGDRKRLLQHEVEQIVVEAKRVGLDLDQLVQAIESQWSKLERPVEVG